MAKPPIKQWQWISNIKHHFHTLITQFSLHAEKSYGVVCAAFGRKKIHVNEIPMAYKIAVLTKSGEKP
jgi:hypothetical protein